MVGCVTGDGNTDIFGLFLTDIFLCFSSFTSSVKNTSHSYECLLSTAQPKTRDNRGTVETGGSLLYELMSELSSFQTGFSFSLLDYHS